MQIGWAKPREEAALVEFANMVFSREGQPTDMVRFQPRVYGRPGFSALTRVAREEGALCGMVSAITGTLALGEDRLTFGFIGTVSTHPAYRGRGIMQELMHKSMMDLGEQGCDFLALGGQRQRYQYYGFEDAGSRLHLNLTTASLKHALGGKLAKAYRFTPLEELQEKDLDYMFALHRAGDMRVIRERRDFKDILRTWDGTAFLVCCNQKPEGYFYSHSGQLAEACMENAKDLPYAIADFMNQKDLQELKVILSEDALRENKALFAAADSCRLTPGKMIKVLNWQKFLQTLLRYKAVSTPLMKGSRVLEIEGAGTYEITIAGRDIQVQESDKRPDMRLDAMAAVRLVCHPLSPALNPEQAFLNWFPLPLFIPDADTF